MHGFREQAHVHLGLAIDVGSLLQQEVHHLGVSIVTCHDERSVSQLREKTLVTIKAKQPRKCVLART